MQSPRIKDFLATVLIKTPHLFRPAASLPSIFSSLKNKHANVNPAAATIRARFA